MTIRSILAIATVAMIASCQKKSNDTIDPSKVMVSISNPIGNQSFHNGDTLQVNAHVSYTSELHGYEVKVVDTSTGTILFDYEEHVHMDVFDVDKRWPVAVSAATNAVVTIVVSIDHNGETATKEVGVRLDP
ncbi:MAG: hypothetical protein KF744_11695 [Taibaiella sp.]|nr:hypothetical protein [Taibaiella sp.]